MALINGRTLFPSWTNVPSLHQHLDTPNFCSSGIVSWIGVSQFGKEKSKQSDGYNGIVIDNGPDWGSGFQSPFLLRGFTSRVESIDDLG
jgi:hypothetical protein